MKLLLSCSVCNKNNWHKHFTKLVECSNCGFIRANDSYFNINSTKLYDSNYFKGSDYGDYSKEQNALEKNFADRIQRIRKFKKGGRLLEIGCAYGYFLKLADKYFETYGIDINPRTTSIAKSNTKAKIFTGDLLSIKLPENYFDVICMFDTIEHLKFPDKYILKISKILKKGGILIIETGDIGSLLSKAQGENWRLITPPIHLQYFTNVSLKSLLQKHRFRVLATERVIFFRSLRQIIYKLSRTESPRFSCALSFQALRRLIPRNLETFLRLHPRSESPGFWRSGYKLIGRSIINSTLHFLSYPVGINTFDLLFVVAQKE